MINYRAFTAAEIYELDERDMAEAAMSAAEAREEAVRDRFGQERFEWAMNMIERRRRARRARRAARAARRAG